MLTVLPMLTLLPIPGQGPGRAGQGPGTAETTAVRIPLTLSQPVSRAWHFRQPPRITSAVAIAASPSPRPVKPSPSEVAAETATGAPTASVSTF